MTKISSTRFHRHISLLILFLSLLGTIYAQNQTDWNSIRIVPKPAIFEVREGSFTLNSQTKIYYPEKDSAWSVPAHTFIQLARVATGFRLNGYTIKNKLGIVPQNSIFFTEDTHITNPEGYEIEIQHGSIKIAARTAQGAFYGLQTLRQLFPPEINAQKMEAKDILWQAPACYIKDAPRFSYRGMHLDVARHYFPVDFIKKYIDLLAFHKLNTFHWHLTEDQGWRIEIPNFPKLQTTAACRDETMNGHYRDRPRSFDGKEYCAYYTLEEIREVVRYAQKRFVTIIPEIEMPGHSQAALTAYPELGCTGGPYETAKTWGVFEEVYCAGNEKTFEFLETVLQTVIELFPSEYIHIGGDECPKTRWERCPKCQKRIANQGLKGTHELQSYFIQRIEKYLARFGKKIIAWDEILEGGLAPNATVMSWRGTEGGIAAAKQKHNVVMTPTSHCYFDYYQANPEVEPLAIGGFLTLEKVFNYEPMPSELTEEEQQYILGVQGNVWTEYMPTSKKVEYMAFPRACALAEIAWVQPHSKNWVEFSKRIQNHFVDLEAMKVNYAQSFYNVKISNASGFVKMSTNDSNLEIHYTLDGTKPKESSPIYKDSFPLDKNLTIKALAFEKGKPKGKVSSASYMYHKASGLSYSLSNTLEKFSGQNELALTDGSVGSLKSWGDWIGVTDDSLAPTFDFGEAIDIRRIKIHSLDAKSSWIWGASKIVLYTSDDGITYKEIAKQKFNPKDYETDGIIPAIFDFKKPIQTRYLKTEVLNFGEISEGFSGAGNQAWLFIDEIIVE